MKRLLALLTLVGSLVSAFAFPSYDLFTSYSNGSLLGGNTAPSGDSWIAYTNGATLGGSNVCITNYFSAHSDGGYSALPANFPGPGISGNNTAGFSVWTPGWTANGTGAGVGACLQFSRDIPNTSGAKIFVSFFVDIPDCSGPYGAGVSLGQGWSAGFLPQSQLPSASGANQNVIPALFDKFNCRAVAGGTTWNPGVGDTNNNSNGAGAVSQATIHFIVMAYEWAGGAGSDSEKIWKDTAAGNFGGASEPGSASVSHAAVNALPDAAGFFFLAKQPASGAIPNSGIIFNSLRIGSTWSYVTGGPEFTNQPVSLTNGLGGTAIFAGNAVASLSPLTYQWQKGGVNLSNGNGISGSTSATLTIASLASGNADSYTLIATDPISSITSSVATLTLVDPYIISATQSVTLPPGSNAVFSVTASGTSPFFYQWQMGAVNLSDGPSPSGSGATISGSSTASLTISDIGIADSGSSLACIVTNSADIPNTATSLAAILTVVDPAITSQPQNANQNYGTAATLTVAALGTPTLTYQWLLGGVPVSNGSAPAPGSAAVISGSQSAVLTLSGVDYLAAGSYSVIVSNGNGDSVISSNAVLTVNDPLLLASPNGLTLTNGIGQSAVFTVAASGTSPLSYQWQLGGINLTNGPSISGTGATISGSTTASLTVANVYSGDAGSYSATVTNGGGNVSSVPAVLTVVAPVIITNPPLSQTNIVGAEAVFSVGVVGTSPGYQWAWDGTNLDGATTSVLSVTNLQLNSGGTYSVVITNAFSTNSASAILTVSSTFNVNGDLAGWWKFDDGSGLTAADSSGNGNTGSLQGFASDNSEWMPGILGDALIYGKSNNVVIVPDSPTLNFTNNLAFTLSLWVYPDVLPASQINGTGLIAKGADNASPEYFLDIFNDGVHGNNYRFVCFHSSGYSILYSPAPPTPFVWQHIVITYDGTAGGSNGVMSIYTNGVVVPGSGGPGSSYEGTLTNAPTSLANNSHSLSIGSRQAVNLGVYGNTFQGLIDDVRIYNFALSAGQVQAVYAASYLSDVPAITSITILSDGSVQLTLAGPSGDPYRLWSSPDPTLSPVSSTWTLLSSGTFSAGMPPFIDSQVTLNNAYNFYVLTSP